MTYTDFASSYVLKMIRQTQIACIDVFNRQPPKINLIQETRDTDIDSNPEVEVLYGGENPSNDTPTISVKCEANGKIISISVTLGSP
jgi:hypothetical protein